MATRLRMLVRCSRVVRYGLAQIMSQPALLLSADEVRMLLRLMLSSGGSKAAFCRKHCINPTSISNTLSSERPPSPQILKALGLTSMVVYCVRDGTLKAGEFFR